MAKLSSVARIAAAFVSVLLTSACPIYADDVTKVSDGKPSPVPSLVELASKWLDVNELAHMPSLHNYHDMAACAPDLIGVNYNPDGQLFDWPTGPRWFRY